MSRSRLVRALAVPVVGGAGLAAGAESPSARKAPATDTYHGVTVTEDYRWLEDPASPEVRAWVDAENRATRAHLDALPARGVHHHSGVEGERTAARLVPVAGSNPG